MVIVQCGTSQHCAMGMKSGAGNRGRTVMVKKAGVRFESRKVSAINIEGLHFVAVGAPGRRVS